MKDGNPREGKPPRTPVAITPSGELTCSEGQVEDLLSEGESTEKETPNLRKQPEQKPFPRNIPQGHYAGPQMEIKSSVSLS